MAYTTLEALKAQLNIETTFTDDDTYMTTIISVVERAVKDYCDGGLDTYTDLTMPETVKHATLFLGAHLYINRTMVSFGTGLEIPYSFSFLLDFYKVYTVR
jgi:hypothetical protein